MREQRTRILVELGAVGGATVAFLLALWCHGSLRWVLTVVALAGVWHAILGGVRAQMRLARFCLVDPLTGLYNRRYLERRLDDEAARVARYGGDFAVCMLDIDDFKAFNDRYGHMEGDRRLRQSARVLRAAIRRTDTAFRYGGEEFVLLLPECDAPGAEEVAARVLEGLRGIGLTASAGVADLLCGGDEPQTVLRCADDACLRAKAAGKDRVMSALPELLARASG